MRIILFLLTFSFTSKSFGQQYINEKKIITVVPQREIYLNGGARASVGGKSRMIIPIQLPPKTVSWYYSFSTSPGESGTKNLNLLAQLTSSLLINPSGITNAALDGIEIPLGSASVDVYLLDGNNTNAFEAKLDNDGRTFQYYRDGSTVNTRQAVMPIYNKTNGPYYLGLKNPSTFDGIKITIEVVAEVNVPVYEDKWSNSNKEKIYNDCIRTFSTVTTAQEQICNCYVDNIIANYVPSAYSNYSGNDLKRIFSEQVKVCSEKTGNSSVWDRENRIRELSELLQGQSIAKDYVEQEKSLIELIHLGLDNYNVYNSLGFCQLCLKKFPEAKRNLTIGLGKNPSDLYLLGNLANYFLLTNQYDLSIKIFLEHRNKRLRDNVRFKDAVADDLKEFERLGISNSHFQQLRKDLRIR